MKKFARTFCAFGLAAGMLVALPGCLKSDSLPVSTTETILKSNVVVINDSTSAGLESIDSTSLVFKRGASAADSAGEGTILISGPSVKAPNGYARKIVSKVAGATTIKVITANVGLTDIFEQADISYTTTASPYDSLARTTTDEFNYPLALPADAVIKATGNASFTNTFTFKFQKVKGSAPKFIEYALQTTGSNTLNTTAKSAAGKTFNLHSWNLKPAVARVTVGGVSLPLIVFSNTLQLSASFSSNAKFAANIATAGTHTIIARYENGTWRSFSSDSLTAESATPNRNDWEWNSTAKALIGMDLTTRLWGSASVAGNIGANVGLVAASDTTKDPDYTLAVGGNMHQRISAAFLGSTLTGCDIDEILTSKIYKQTNWILSNQYSVFKPDFYSFNYGGDTICADSFTGQFSNITVNLGINPAGTALNAGTASAVFVEYTTSASSVIPENTHSYQLVSSRIDGSTVTASFAMQYGLPRCSAQLVGTLSGSTISGTFTIRRTDGVCTPFVVNIPVVLNRN
jgi:hypothetical protein